MSSVIFYFFILLFDLSILFLCFACVGLFFLSWHAVSKYQIGTLDPDPKEIVIDEVLGTLICLLALPISLNPISYIVTAFIVFRVLDYFKPSVIYRFQLQNTDLSIILDDVMASLLTFLIVFSLDLNGFFPIA